MVSHLYYGQLLDPMMTTFLWVALCGMLYNKFMSGSRIC